MALTPATVEVDFITPRHLAGGGDPAWVTVPLHRACGWSHGSDPLIPRVLLSSPDQKALLRLEPEPGGPWWTLKHAAEPNRPAWQASFDARTPVELIAAVTDALTNPAPTRSAPCDPYEPLRAFGWSPYEDDGLLSPDKTAYVERLGPPGRLKAWLFTTTVAWHQRLWQARFDEHTPARLVTAFTAALADPTPVARTDGGRGLATLDPNLIARRTTDVLATLVAEVLDERVHTLAARRAMRPTSSMPPRQPPAQRGHSR
ncbi:DUF317 domain-containing protein [Streptomyces buecherae]|uniref:DUF317 domain-containing protein n=1 Tax=Streptomyces buecherae TaxID=2763006 RepID=UPI003650A11D